MPAAPARMSGTPRSCERLAGADVGLSISTTDHWPPPGNAGAPHAAMTNSGPPIPSVTPTPTLWRCMAWVPEPTFHTCVEWTTERSRLVDEIRVLVRANESSGCGDLDEAELVLRRGEAGAAVGVGRCTVEDEVAVEIDSRQVVAADLDNLAGVENVHDVGDTGHHARMRDDRRIGELVDAVSDRLPAAVASRHNRVVATLDGDGAHYEDPVREEMLRTWTTSYAVRPINTSKRAWTTAGVSEYGFSESLKRDSPYPERSM